jgi:hypothetical protein
MELFPAVSILVRSTYRFKTDNAIALTPIFQLDIIHKEIELKFDVETSPETRFPSRWQKGFRLFFGEV